VNFFCPCPSLLHRLLPIYHPLVPLEHSRLLKDFIFLNNHIPKHSFDILHVIQLLFKFTKLVVRGVELVEVDESWHAFDAFRKPLGLIILTSLEKHAVKGDKLEIISQLMGEEGKSMGWLWYHAFSFHLLGLRRGGRIAACVRCRLSKMLGEEGKIGR